jgi:hypothetical protein
MPYPREGERPRFREPHPIRLPAVAAGAGCAVVWYALFGLVWGGAAGYVWLSILAGVSAGAVALLLALRGDRGVATGIALVSGVALAVAGVVLVGFWISGNWLLW